VKRQGGDKINDIFNALVTAIRNSSEGERPPSRSKKFLEIEDSGEYHTAHTVVVDSTKVSSTPRDHCAFMVQIVDTDPYRHSHTEHRQQPLPTKQSAQPHNTTHYDDDNIVALMMTTSDAGTPAMGRPTPNQLLRKVKETLIIVRQRREHDETNRHLPQNSEEQGDMEDVIAFNQIRLEDLPQSYGVILQDEHPKALFNILFQDYLKEKQTQHEEQLFEIGQLLRDRHAALQRHAIQQYETYTSTLQKYQTASHGFTFKFDPTVCVRPDRAR